jgi:F0F1-type ATP synthase membrane subunit b/b'
VALIVDPDRGELATMRRSIQGLDTRVRATTDNCGLHKVELERRFAEVRQASSHEVAQASAELRATVDSVRAETREQIASLRDEMRAEFSDLRDHVDATMLELVKQLGGGKA